MIQDIPEQQSSDFVAVQLRVASPEDILSWSHGEVLKPETINYRTQKPERDGLFCERIFGPTKDYECYCGKYKKIRYKGIICDKCGVEVTKSSVRRQRMGHIDLAVPVAHTWYMQNVPSAIGMLLDMSVSDLEKVSYFAAYVILEVNEEVRKDSLAQLEQEYHELRDQLLGGKPATEVSGEDLLRVQQLEATYKESRKEIDQINACQVISEITYHDLSLKFGSLIRVGIGAEAIRDLLKGIDLEKGIEKLKIDAQTASVLNRRKALRRLKLFTDLKNAAISPEWMVLTRLPLTPPDLRPMVQLDGGRYAASDLNDLYRRVLNRNNRLKKLLNTQAPEVITRNEKRMLQEAVDALIDNSARRGKAAAAAATGVKRRLKSLSDMLRGKQGRFRQNLLGKRVDYSGRSVIVVGPSLRLDECGLPKMMALELFKPFVIGRLISTNEVSNVRNASRMIEEGAPIVWDILEDITRDHYVLLNRAPTLHRLGIQAFRPVLIEGKSIQVHPLVCTAYNADFDGDQMAVHVPLSKPAQQEARDIMRASKNLLKPSSGEVIVSPNKDMVLGTYFMTMLEDGANGEGKAFSSADEAIMAHDAGAVALRAKVKVLVDGELRETSVGQVLFNQVLPAELGYQTEVMDKKVLDKLVVRCFKELGTDRTAQLVDDLKDLGFRYAERSGITFAMSDLIIPEAREGIITDTENQLEEIGKQYRRGLITETERYVKTVEHWLDATKRIEKEAIAGFTKDNPLMMMVTSGARGKASNINQLAGMKGLVANPTGQVIDIPIKRNFKQGLTVFEYFISTHGSRKGRADTALRTADAGYLTRRLVDVSQDVVIAAVDCGSTEGVTLFASDAKAAGENFENTLIGRYLCGEQAGIAHNTLIDEDAAHTLATLGEVKVRSALYCEESWGICQHCYGTNIATGKLVEMGEAVGIVAAQAIGEPGTQLTMRTFHTGGVATAGGDITAGLPRVEELFEARSPKTPAVMAEINGVATVEETGEGATITIRSQDHQQLRLAIPQGFTIQVQDRDAVQVKDVVAVHEDGRSIRSTISGAAKVESGFVVVTANEQEERTYSVASVGLLTISHGDAVVKGQALTEGHLELQSLLQVSGRTAVERYVVAEVQKIYSSQGSAINNKHVEIIIRQMLSKLTVTDPGESRFITGQTVDHTDFRDANKAGERVMGEQQLLGVSRVSLRTKSFLSAASFQETTSVLIDAAVQGKRDELRGLKENVIIGKLIPAGTGYKAAQD